MFYYDEIPFATILSNPFLSIETMNENSMERINTKRL